MRRVLLDGTTLMSASRLLNGEEKPNALNFWSLSLLVECLILHDEIIVLDTLHDDPRLTIAARNFDNLILVEHRSVKELIDRYIEIEFPRLSGLSSLSSEELRRVRLQDSRYNGIDEAERHLRRILETKYSDDDGMADYLDTLEKVHARQLAELAERKAKKEPLKRFMNRHFSTISFFMYGFDTPWGPIPPNDDGTEVGTICGDTDICGAWEGFVERYTNAGSSSTWHAGKGARQSFSYKFTPALLIRTHLYLLASEVLGAPYRPDILRAPICWKFFALGSFAEYGMEERFVDAAERLGQEQVRGINEFLGRPAFASLPLFLAGVFARSGRAGDIIEQAVSIRTSKPAVRFREHLAQLNAAEAAGDFESIAKEINRYSIMLNKAYGDAGGPPDVIWSLGASAAKAIAGPSPMTLFGLGADAGKGAVVASGIARSWWYRRKMALIAKTIQQAKKAGAMQPQLRRLFGVELDVGELDFIERVSKITSLPSGNHLRYQSSVEARDIDLEEIEPRDPREALKYMIRSRGMARKYTCEDCGVEISGHNLVHHFDKAHPKGSFRANSLNE
jgi:hypothetical protein